MTGVQTCALPIYHDKTFQSEVQLNGLPIGAGSGHSKKEAEQAAAKAALETLEET